MLQSHQSEMSTTDFQALSEKMDKVIQLLVGNDLDDDDKGLIGEFREVKTDVEELKEFRKKLLNRAVGFVTAITIFWGIIQLAVNYLSNHQH
jgi:hypothetical protein